MAIKSILAAAFLVPVLAWAWASDPCYDSKTTNEMEECIRSQVLIAEKELIKYLEESKHRLQDDPKSLAELDKAQNAWRAYRDAHCGAIYQHWSSGSVRGIKEGRCLLKQTRQRTHDLWEAYLVYSDSTPPILPEPGSDD